MAKYFAGIGSRNTPDEIGKVIDKYSNYLKWNYILRSGAAVGADSYWKYSMSDYGQRSEFVEIYPPEENNQFDTTGPEIAKSHHPNWGGLSSYVKSLMVRNAKIVLGPNYDDPSDFVIAWTPNAEVVGGTGHSIRIANTYGIPVFNLASEKDVDNLNFWLKFMI